MVEVEQPAEPRPPSHPGRWPHRRWRAAQQLVLKTLMVPLPVVVLDILVDKLSEVSLTQRHDSAETFLFDGANEPVGGELLLSPQSVEIIKFGDPGSGR